MEGIKKRSPFTTWKVGNETYKLRMTTRASAALEDSFKLGWGSLMQRIGNTNIMVPIIHACLEKYNHSISLDETYDLVDTYLEENTLEDLMEILILTFEHSGFLKQGSVEEVEKQKKQELEKSMQR